MNRSKALAIGSVATFAGFYAYSQYKRHLVYPPSVRKPLKRALFLKHKTTKTTDDMLQQESLFKQAIDAYSAEGTKAKAGIYVELAKYYEECGKITKQAEDYALIDQREGFREAVKAYEAAIRCYSKDKEAYTDEDIRYLATIGYSLSRTHKALLEEKKREEWLNWSLNLIVSGGEKLDGFSEELIACFDDLAELHKSQGRYDDAVLVYQGMLRTITEDNTRIGYCRRAYAMNSLADICYETNRRENAVKWLADAKSQVGNGLKYSFLWRLVFSDVYEFCSECKQAIEANAATLKKP